MDFYLLHIEFVLWDKCGTLAAPKVRGDQSALSAPWLQTQLSADSTLPLPV